MDLMKWSTAAALLLSCSVHTSEGADIDPTASVFKVKATLPDGSVALGSAVIIARKQLVASCHVIRNARRIEIRRGHETSAATSRAWDIDHDVCVLSAPGVDAPVPRLGGDATLAVGQSVVAIGYPDGGELAAREGTITGLHTFDGARVIQGSAPFEPGASGGGLFDRQGRLVGILTFKARVGGPFHFAVPVAWVQNVVAGASEGRRERAEAFWQRRKEELPYFLRAASLEAEGNWPELAALAQEWAATDAENPGSWIAAGKALRALQRDADAAATLQTAAQRNAARPRLSEALEPPGRHAAEAQIVRGALH